MKSIVRLMRELQRCVAGGAFMLLVSYVLPAQQVSGVVVEADARTPAALVTVALLDSTGKARWRGQTGSSARFVLDLLEAGRYRVQALRVGFAPTYSDPFQVTAGAGALVRVQLTGVRIQLPRVLVSGRTTCASSSSAGRDVLNGVCRRPAALGIGVGHGIQS